MVVSPPTSEMTPGPVELSLIIPVYNGAEVIGESLQRARDFLGKWGQSYEILVVDDGSSDDTHAVVEELVDDRTHLLRLAVNTGKFAAIQTGMTRARGSCRVFTDADLPYDLEALPYVAELINSRGFHLAVGDRSLSESQSMTSSRVARKASSRVFSFCVRMLVTGGLFDSQCGLKAFDGRVAEAIFPLLTDTGFSGDVELLYIALKYNLSIRRIPVRLQRNSPSTVKLRVHSLPMLFRILALRRNWTSGSYASDTLTSLGSQNYWVEPVQGCRGEDE